MSTSSTARPLPFAFALATGALLVACGGDGGSGGTTTPPTSSGTGQTCTTDVYGTTTCTPTGNTFGGAGGGNYVANALVSDTAATNALHHDANLVNAWGLAFNPQAFAWVANEGSGTSTLYDGNGVAQSLVVTLPQGSNPSGIVFNGGTAFPITANSVSGPATFVFATLEGQIAAWAANVDATHALTVVDDGAAGDSFTGLAISTAAGAERLYAADFHNGAVVTLDGNFAPVATPGGFVDPTLPAGYAPFGIQQIGGKVYVAYAQQDAARQRDVAGAGLGLVDVFDLQGTLLQHLVPTGGALNAPWGLALAPANFGKFSNMLLVGNFGDGTINVYDPATGAQAGTLSNNDGSAIIVPGLWALQFGNDLNSQPSNTLFYTAGPGSEAHGLYGRIDMN